eukprot:PhF_6_TR40164/c2_g3_i5/m.59478
MSGETLKNVKLVTLGRSYVGKTSILHRYVHDDFSCDHFRFDFNVKALNRHTLLPPKDSMDVVNLPQEHIKVHLWDTAGQERFLLFNLSYCRGMHVALLCFDVTDPDSYAPNTLKTYIFDVLEKHSKESCVVAFVGNKIDKLEGKVDSDYDDVDTPCPIALVPPNMHVVVPQDDGSGPRYQHGEYHNRLRVCFYALHVHAYTDDADLSRYFLPYDVMDDLLEYMPWRVPTWYFPVSAKTGEGIDDLFRLLIRTKLEETAPSAENVAPEKQPGLLQRYCCVN